MTKAATRKAPAVRMKKPRVRSKRQKLRAEALRRTRALDKNPPKHVAIVCMGASHSSYTTMACSMGVREEVADEVWAINAMCDVIHHDRAFVMDDVKYILTDQHINGGKKVAGGILRWLPRHPGPVYTTTAYPEWPALIEYPTAAVLQEVGGVPYLTNTVAYAVAFAIYLGVEQLSIFGADFVYPNSNVYEPGRGSVEFQLSNAASRGIAINLPDTTTLLDAHVPNERKLYGYHEPTEAIVVDGKIALRRGVQEVEPTG